MAEHTQRKQWTPPRLTSLGKLAHLEHNDQIDEERKQALIALRDALRAGSQDMERDQRSKKA